MSIEKPSTGSQPESERALSESAATPEKEMTEDEIQDMQEDVSRELFIREWVLSSSDLTPEQKTAASEHIQMQAGVWRQYNGDDVRVVATKLVDGVWHISFGVYVEDYEAQRIDAEIPLSK